MAFKTSTGLRNSILTSGSLIDLLGNGEIRIFAGSVPLSADAAEEGTLLCTISEIGTGGPIFFDGTASDGVVSKNAEVWSGENVASGTATYYRHVDKMDSGVISTTEVRIQGEVGIVGKEMNLSSTAFTSGATQTIDYYSVALPTF